MRAPASRRRCAIHEFCCAMGLCCGVEARAAGGDGACEVEAVFEGDGDSVEWGAGVGVGIEGGELLGSFEGFD